VRSKTIAINHRLSVIAELADECFVQYRLVAESNLSEAGIRGAE
jgi:hypothetical protein